MVSYMSQHFIPTKREAPKDATSRNHQFLARAGYVHQESAGVFTLLPLGVRVLRKIEAIIRRHMEALGGQEIIMPSLEPKANWVKTGRWNTVDILFKLKGQQGNEYALGPTHEEIVMPLAKERITSYKDLPFSLFQIQTKFRDEKRAKSGLVRGREFGMKDLYSFHATKEDLETYYEKAKQEYLECFSDMGLDAKVTEASGGSFTKKYSHEFMVFSDAGEDKILACESCSFAQNAEIANVKTGDSCPLCKKKIVERKAIEVGNIFDLSTKFSEDFDLVYVDEHGKKQLVVAGCYGIGTTRLIGTIAEVFSDEKGLQWPAAVAPYNVHVVALDVDDEAVTSQLKEFLLAAKKHNHDVLIDDRKLSAGVKFADADLIGIPLRVVISKKTAAAKQVEIKLRTELKSELVTIAEVWKQ